MIKKQFFCRGFTLIELMVTIAIAAVLMMIAVPSMVSFKRNSELTSVTNTLFSAINAARGEAMKRGMRAMVVPNNNGSDWSTGWIVFIDNDRSQTFNASTDQVVLTQSAMPSYITVTGNGSATGTVPYIMFNPSGYSVLKNAAFGAMTLEIARNDVASGLTLEQTRRLKIAATGRARTCKPVSATDNACKNSTDSD